MEIKQHAIGQSVGKIWNQGGNKKIPGSKEEQRSELSEFIELTKEVLRGKFKTLQRFFRK